MKILKLLKGLLLSALYIKSFDPEKRLKGKRVAVVGPADSAFDNKNGQFIDEFDYVIRINKAVHSWTKESSKFVGSKTHILFHSFFENNDSGGGPLDIDLFDSLKIEYLINPRTDLSSYRRTFYFFRKYSRKTPVYHLPNKFYNRMIKPFGKFQPTVGYTAIYSALNSECETLFITGFTFFQTPYSPGYRDHLIDMERNMKHIQQQGIHDIKLEFRLFRKNLETSSCKNIIIDPRLEELIAEQP